MSDQPAKPRVFISYAHADEPEKPGEGEIKWLSFVTGYLRPAVKQGAVEIWIDGLMRGGDLWDAEIERKLHECDIFILLVSRHSMSSDYVVDEEIAIISERQARGEDVHFYPLLLTPTPRIALELLRDRDLRPRDVRPLSSYSINDRYRHMSDAADEIAEIAVEIAKRKGADRGPLQALSLPQSSSPSASTTPVAIMGRAGTFVSAPTEEPPEQEVQVTDPISLGLWLAGQNREVAIAIAVRAALRVAPLASRIARKGVGPQQQRELTHVTGAIFRALASARMSVQDPDRTFNLSARNAAGAASDSSVVAIVAAEVASAAMFATSAAANSAAAAAAANPDAPSAAAAAVRAFVEAFKSADLSASDAEAAAWNQIRSDIEATKRDGVGTLLTAPLWRQSEPTWARRAEERLQAALPEDEDWDVWIDWYEVRLRGGSRGETYEVVFARVPQEEWDKSPAAANAWIKAHLPKGPKAPTSPEFPTPLPGLDAPFTYSWTASQRVAIVAGPQNLPFYPHFSSEEDHRHALEACRLGAERLLKALRDGRYNARKEYGEALEYYLDDLPKTAGAGNILLANDQVRILHAMFLAEARDLPDGFASRLKSVIANQFALNAFYDLVQRHNEAVSAGNWAQPFPLDAAKSFFGAVEDSTPRWFEREVEQGLRQVEQAQLPAATTPEPAPASAIEPPPLPPGTPDARDSWRWQMATAANALWETFLQGRDMPVAQDEWREAAEKLGANVPPLIDFLRALDAPK
jgi:hypothetical protein